MTSSSCSGGKDLEQNAQFLKNLLFPLLLLYSTSVPGTQGRTSKSQHSDIKIDHIPCNLQLTWPIVASSAKFVLRPLCCIRCILTEFCAWNGDVWSAILYNALWYCHPQFVSCFLKASFGRAAGISGFFFFFHPVSV